MSKVNEIVSALRKDSKSSCEHMLLDMIEREIPQWHAASEWSESNKYTGANVLSVNADGDVHLDNSWSFGVEDGKLSRGWGAEIVYWMIVPEHPVLPVKAEEAEAV